VLDGNPTLGRDNNYHISPVKVLLGVKDIIHILLNYRHQGNMDQLLCNLSRLVGIPTSRSSLTSLQKPERKHSAPSFQRSRRRSRNWMDPHQDPVRVSSMSNSSRLHPTILNHSNHSNRTLIQGKFHRCLQ
jgi:hypothetical protein